MNASTTTSTYPATVRELGEMAEARGMKAWELLDELGPFSLWKEKAANS